MDILCQVKRTIQRWDMLHIGDKIVVAVSGGPDSVTLLYLLNSLKKELKIKLYVAHLDHMLRNNSYKDRIFVENLTHRLKLPLTTAQVNLKALARRGSQEEIARNARLGFLFRVAKETKANKIALGHNLDDQAETVLMRILRGSGLQGLSGIIPKRKIAGFWFIRPLIEVRRKEIVTFLRKKKIRPRIDISNLQDIYFRNKIRNRLLPLLEKEYNKNIKKLLSNMATSLGSDYDYLNQQANLTIKRLKSRLYLSKFCRLHPAIRRLVLRLSITRLAGDTRRITFQHIREIEDLILNRPVNSIVDLPKGVSVVKKKDFLSFYLR